MSTIDFKPSLMDEILDFLVSNPSLDQIVALRPSPAIQQRLEQLLDQNRNATLSTAERSELDEYLRLDQFVTLLKARARKKLAEQ